MDLLGELRTRRALCIVRAPAVPDPVGLTGTLVDAGLPMIEIAFTTPNAPRVIEQASTVDGALIGAGTVMTAAMARDAVNAGARYLLTPGLRDDVAEEAERLGIPVVLGAFTPTEVADAMDIGAAAVKVFPAARLGPAYFRDLRGPYPDVPLVASGGVNAGNAAAYLAAGAIAVTAGSGVVPPDLTDLDRIRLRASEFVAAVKEQP
ncbi:2-dehydro-3-deoxyphosphogluconate aldolase/(4S)-4-hydroxy-2-oxoglutarate aldolase [Herbihabitans rhizosphaerae]|uniref:2-dehydro-3-deoxyphosphogluconate aldolase/(4S)-4-hydroxy-2-oxoglutarate aldolase n=1 Tax=Herbihabitans rhizosphaerae TaxID=1872711 RepID=A0A4Q7L204_9PSEU|nr:bifunctional 4-hydroxy-2-oxoglutarate aldolase/2-dehydro-3-deoxy-phosphogluconate aldolase [Herbihabitans rhizosphaerae]RZS43559.1 2-dehydro-3-deoxyphosphogluconate aldolase/(4S)-4-hydroxy-2-oxoglutarate aldolase [Herbihabitans rhizosphaerae]